MKKRLLSLLLLLLLLAIEADAQTLTVTTNPRYARGATMAFARMTVSGSGISEQGFCWAETPQPTINDNKTTKYLSKNGKIYWLQNLTPATMYYMRAYAIATNGDVYYGNDIKFCTIPKGTISYTIRAGAPDDVNTRITNATKSAVDYWNNLTSITGFSTSVGYDAGVATADCSYGGWVRMGPNTSYQRTGTLLHELLHGVGVIPWANTEWSRHNLRSDVNGDGYGTGQWLGDRATEVVRFLANNNTDVLSGDYQHMWPYGINGAHEDDGSELLYIANSLVIQALGEDGLQHTGSSFSRPYFSFDNNPADKYYIKNEDADCGLASSYLTITRTGSLTVKVMSSEQAAANDSAAWTITFSPSNQYYQLRNVATGRYITYTAANTISTIDQVVPSTSENFQFMPGRNKVDTGDPDLDRKAYWIIHPEGNWSPKCLAGVANSANTTAATFNIATSATNQRWLLIPSAELSSFDMAAVSGMRKMVSRRLASLETLLAVPHLEDVAGIDARMAQLVERVNETVSSSVDVSVLAALNSDIDSGIRDFLNSATPSDVNHPFDLTFMMSDPELSSADGWSIVPTISYSCAEFYEKTFDFNQVLNSMPKGTYQLRAKAFQRPGTSSQAWSNYSSGQSKVTAFLFLGSSVQKVADICAYASDTKLGGTETSVGSPAKYIPNNMLAGSKYFAAGLYENGVVYENKTKGGQLKMGIRSSNMGTSYWCMFDDFRLYFFGTTPKTSVGITDVTLDTHANALTGIYTLDGRLVSRDATALPSLPKGIYIINGKKVVR